MNKILTIGTLLSALFFGMKAKNTADAADKITFDVSRVKWKGWSHGGVLIDIFFRLTNPTSTEVKVNYLFTEISLPDGPRLTSISRSSWNQTIQKENTSEILVPVKLMFTDLLKVSLTLLKNFQAGKMPKQVQIKGHTKVNNIPVEFDELVDVA